MRNSLKKFWLKKSKILFFILVCFIYDFFIEIFFERIAHSLIFGLKTSDSLGKPMSEFPALKKLFHYHLPIASILG